MSVILGPLYVAMLVAIAGMVAGWLLAQRGDSAGEGDQLGEIDSLTTDLASHLDEHKNRIRDLSAELTGKSVLSPESVALVVDKLIQTNQQAQRQLETSEDELRRKALALAERVSCDERDPLTSLGNRRAFERELARRLSEYQRQQRCFTLLMLDVDQFKRFNDRHGHRAGDEVLRGIATILAETTRQMDVVTRFGGEEFAVIMSGTSLDESKQGAERIREAIAASEFEYESIKRRVTVSFGLATVQEDDSEDTVINRADSALYVSKESGRNCGHWHDGAEIHRITPPEEFLSAALVAETAFTGIAPAVSQQGNTSVPDGKTRKENSLHDTQPRPSAGLDGWSEKITGLCNHSAFAREVHRRTAEWKRTGATFSVVIAEIDDYAALALQHGDETARLVLRATARLLEALIREMDLAARYDEASFGVLLPSAELADAMKIAERMRAAARDCEIPHDGDSLHYTISAGVSEVEDGDDAQSLLQRADDALAAAIRKGSNLVYMHNGVRPVVSQQQDPPDGTSDQKLCRADS